MSNNFCTRCGNLIEDGKLFCGKCGNRISAPDTNMNGMNDASNMSGMSGMNNMSNMNDMYGMNNASNMNGMNNASNMNGMSGMNNMSNMNGTSGIKSTISKVLSSVLDFIKNTNKIVLAVIAGAVALVMLAIVIVGAVMIFGKGYKKPLDNMCKAFEKEDTDLLCSIISEYQLEYYDDIYDGDYEDNLEAQFDEMYDEYGEDLTVTYEIEEKDRLSETELRRLKRNLCEEIDGLYDEDEIKISDAYELEVEIKFEGEEGKERNDSKITVVKEKGKWRILF